MPEMKETVIENGTELEGSIHSECPVTLSGKLEGQVSAPMLTVTASGSARGEIKVSKLVAHGEISGEIEADEVQLGGRVSDQTVIRARTLEVALSRPQGGFQVTFGTCELHVGDPDKRRTGQHEEETESMSAVRAQREREPRT